MNLSRFTESRMGGKDWSKKNHLQNIERYLNTPDKNISFWYKNYFKLKTFEIQQMFLWVTLTWLKAENSEKWGGHKFCLWGDLFSGKRLRGNPQVVHFLRSYMVMKKRERLISPALTDTVTYFLQFVLLKKKKKNTYLSERKELCPWKSSLPLLFLS